MNNNELLEQVNAAIGAIMTGGQSYKIGSRSLTRANLTELSNLRDKLAAEAATGEETTLLADTYVVFFTEQR